MPHFSVTEVTTVLVLPENKTGNETADCGLRTKSSRFLKLDYRTYECCRPQTLCNITSRTPLQQQQQLVQLQVSFARAFDCPLHIKSDVFSDRFKLLTQLCCIVAVNVANALALAASGVQRGECCKGLNSAASVEVHTV